MLSGDRLTRGLQSSQQLLINGLALFQRFFVFVAIGVSDLGSEIGDTDRQRLFQKFAFVGKWRSRCTMATSYGVVPVTTHRVSQLLLLLYTRFWGDQVGRGTLRGAMVTSDQPHAHI